MNGILAHGSEDAVRELGDYIGSPMYQVIPEHDAAVLGVALLAATAWFVRRAARREVPWAARLADSYRRLSPLHRFLVWLLGIAGAVHAGLVIGHEPSGYTLAYAVGAILELAVARRVLFGQRFRLSGGLVLGGSIAVYIATNVGGEPPDQMGIATKLIELAALAIILTPATERRFRRALTSATIVIAMVVVAIGAFAGAFIGVDGGHHVGEAAQPGTLIPTGEDRPPTPHEVAEADEIYLATLAAVEKYENPDRAAQDGYNIAGMFGTEFHAANEAYKHDGRIFDPERPENLVYAVTDSGPILIGVMFEMEDIGDAGPAIAGPLTVWHAHDHVCFSLTPPALAGLTSPFGVCPMGSITMPMTNEMIHLWTVPGAPEKIGHIEDEWLDAYLERFKD